MAVGTEQYESLKHRAAYKVKLAIKNGEIPHAATLSCKDCGNPAYCYDHRDYSKPLMVEPVCRRCNVRRGPAINAPEGYKSNERRNKTLKTHWNNSGVVVQNASAAYIDIADFPGHCVIDIDDRIFELCETQFNFSKDDDVVAGMYALSALGPKRYRSAS